MALRFYQRCSRDFEKTREIERSKSAKSFGDVARR